jgi:hypothetical protein
VQWLEWCVSIAAGADLAFALVGCVWLTGYAWSAETAARRAGAAALALINGSMVLEAALFLAIAKPAADGPAAYTAAVVVVRGVLLGSSVLTMLLLLRSPALRR